MTIIHDAETGFAVNKPAWSGASAGTSVSSALDVAAALRESKLNWQVKKVPIYADWKNQAKKVEGRWGVQRQSDGKVLGTVGGTWQPVQNTDGFQVLQDLIEEAGGQVRIDSAGALDDGKKVWIIAECSEELQIKIAGESYASYIGFVNGHDGRTSVTAFMLDLRLACTNMLTYTLNKEDAKHRIVRVRHTTKATERIKEARHVLRMRNLRAEELARQGEWLCEQSMDEGAFASFLESLMPIAEEGTPAATMVGQRREAVSDLYFDAENLAPIRGTAWGALQAVTEYVDHGRMTKNQSALVKTQFGLTPSALKQRAYDLLVS